jgi:hypothetical protein
MAPATTSTGAGATGLVRAAGTAGDALAGRDARAPRAIGSTRAAGVTPATPVWTRAAIAARATATARAAGAARAATVASAATPSWPRLRGPRATRITRRITGSPAADGTRGLGPAPAVRATAAGRAGAGRADRALRARPGRIRLITRARTAGRVRASNAVPAGLRARTGMRVERAGVFDRSSSHAETKRLPRPGPTGHVARRGRASRRPGRPASGGSRRSRGTPPPRST